MLYTSRLLTSYKQYLVLESTVTAACRIWSSARLLSVPKCVVFIFVVHTRRGGSTFENLNPATEELICRCANAQAEDVDEAVAAARGW